MGAWVAFLEVHARVVRALEQEMQEEQGLSLVWYDVLIQLEIHGGRLRMCDLAESVLLSRSNITRMVDRMVYAGLVAREQCPEDRRGLYAVLTEKGRSVLQSAHPGHRQGIYQHFLQYLDQDDVKTVYKALSKVLEAETGRPVEVSAIEEVFARHRGVPNE